MAISSEMTALLERLYQDLDVIKQQVTEGLDLARRHLYHFPNNALLIQLFASLNNALLFRETSKRVIEETVEDISADDVLPEIVQETGEDLATLLGRVVEVRISVSRIKDRLSNWP